MESFHSIDVCPIHYLSKTYPTFDSTVFVEHDWNESFKERDWTYTMSLTLFIDRETCFVNSESRAANDCHLVHLKEVFMLYLSDANQARFHFYAEKNYFESQTPQFFVPYNQWITIQMTMSQFGGYKVVMLDNNGEELVSISR
jgi:hypothetical protein